MGVGLHEAGQAGGQMQHTERHRRIDAQRAARLVLQAADLEIGLLRLAQDAGAMAVIDLAHLGEAEPAGGAVQQPRTQPVLQPADMLGDGGFRQAQRPGGG